MIRSQADVKTWFIWCFRHQKWPKSQFFGTFSKRCSAIIGAHGALWIRFSHSWDITFHVFACATVRPTLISEILTVKNREISKCLNHAFRLSWSCFSGAYVHTFIITHALMREWHRGQGSLTSWCENVIYLMSQAPKMAKIAILGYIFKKVQCDYWSTWSTLDTIFP